MPSGEAVGLDILGLDPDGLPGGWRATTMGEVSEVVGGATPRVSEPGNFADEGSAWITPADLSGFNGVRIRRGGRCLTEKGLRGCSARMMPAGTVLMSSRAPIGYIAVAEGPISTNQGFKSFVCQEGLVPEYVYYWLRFANPLLQAMGSGSTFTEISGRRAREIPIILPPTDAEQQRIVAKIEELLTHVNAARTHLARVPPILKRLRQSVLAAACSGALVPEQRGRETTTIGDLSERVTSGSRDWKAFYTPEGPSTFVLTQNVRPLLFDPEMYQGVAPPRNHRDCERSRIEKDDLLVTIVGANTGDSCRVPSRFTDYFVCQSVALVRLRDRRHSRFLELWLNSPLHGLHQLAERTYGEGRPHLGLAGLRNVEVTLPSLDDQAEINRRTGVLFALADIIEQRVAAATARADRFTQSILAKAFRGELVSIDAEIAHRTRRV